MLPSQTEMPRMPGLPKDRVLTAEWEAAFRAWQARLRDYLVEKELHMQQLERLLRAAARRVPVPGISYTPDAEDTTYTGINNLQLGDVYAQVADLNNLRVAYENLRAAFDILLVTLQ